MTLFGLWVLFFVGIMLSAFPLFSWSLLLHRSFSLWLRRVTLKSNLRFSLHYLSTKCLVVGGQAFERHNDQQALAHDLAHCFKGSWSRLHPNVIICAGFAFTHVKQSQLSVQGNNTWLSFPLVVLSQNLQCFSTERERGFCCPNSERISPFSFQLTLG